ncbi:uncharacterized protein [Temnothorax nylanderi]|uniref:uncharacterized protein n=1 Tax=Temnothorax nylanderi TaxID=102681 RepID=UPI003A8C2A21
MDFLVDSGATLTLIKVGNLKGKTMVREKRLALTGVTGHQIHALGKIKATVDLGSKKIRRTMYVVKDDFPIDYEGILGNDFLTKHKADISNTSKQLKIGKATFKLRPYRKVTLPPRSETIVEAITDHNRPVEILTPHVTLEEMPVNDSADVLTLHATEERKPITARREKLREQLQTDYLNNKERKALKQICDFCDVFYLDGDKLSATTAIEHEINTRADSVPLQPNKCAFLLKEVVYLGHIISEGGISPDPSKLQTVKEFPTLRKVKNIQSFIGLAGYYRKFIENFSKIAKLLTRLTREGEKFTWSVKQQNAFDLLKEKLTTAPVLNYPDFDKEFLVTTDPSDYAIGAVLSQGPVGHDRPIAYASRVLCKAEQNYNTTEKELLAIVWAQKDDTSREYTEEEKQQILYEYHDLQEDTKESHVH